MADTPPPQNSPANNSTESPPGSPPPSSPPPASSPPPQSPPPSSPPPQSPPPSSPPPSSPPPQQSPPESPPPSQSPPPSSPPPSQTTSPSPPPPPSDSSNSKNNSPTASPPPPPPPNHNNNNNNSPNGGDSPGVWKAPPAPLRPMTPANDGPAALRPPGETPGRSSNVLPPTNSSGGSTVVAVPLVVAVAAVAGIVLAAFVLLFLLCRKRKKEIQMEQIQYYRKQSHGNPGGGQQRRNWQNTNEMMNNLPPPPRPGGWAAPPPPISPKTADVSSSIFSGPQGFAVLPPPPPPPMVIGFASQSNFTYEELVAATGGFSPANLLGQGGFGYVHKGILPNGKEVAVKSLKPGSGQGDREFKAEVEIISRVHHRHLVSLVGYCISEDKRLLVYEFVANNNLEFHLHGKGRQTLDFPTRLKIALGSAKGLAYLHEDCHPRIIHRDIKSSNILLDSTGEAKVSDFGLAKLNSENYTHVSTRIMGTFGYLAPEYASSGKLTEKSDVFSFGVVLLELITGRRPVDPDGDMEDSLVDWARPLCLRSHEEGNYDEMADPFLEKNFQAHEMARMVACASACIRHSAKRRPRMSKIVRALEGDVSLEDLINDGAKVANNSLFGGSNTSGGVSSNPSEPEQDHGLYGEEMKRFMKAALASGGPYPSSEFGETSEYGLHLSTSSSESGSPSPRARPIPK